MCKGDQVTHPKSRNHFIRKSSQKKLTALTNPRHVTPFILRRTKCVQIYVSLY